MTSKIPISKMGCWLDGHYGWHNHYEAIKLAQEWGFRLTDDEQRLVDVYRMGDTAMVAAALRQERFGNPGPRGQERVFSADALMAEAEALREEAALAVTGQGGLVERATDHLDSLAPEGTAFHWDMGELSLLCLCQIEGTEENDALMKTNANSCARCKARYSS